MPAIRSALALLTICSLLLLPGQAPAQNLVQRSFAAQLFEPAIGTDTLLSVELAPTASHLGFGLGMVLNYQRRPLVLSTERLDAAGQPIPGSGDEVVVVGNQMTADLVGALGLRYRWLRAQLGFSLPLNLYVSGNEVTETGREGEALSGTLVGDLRLQLKVMLLPRRAGFALALSPLVTLPTGCLAADSCEADGKFGGSAGVTFRPRVVADYRVGPLVLAANVGWLFREDVTVLSTKVGDQLLYGVGAGFTATRRIQVIAELSGRAGFSSHSGCIDYGQTSVCEDSDGADLDRFPLEALVGGQLELGHGLQVSAGAGFGLIQAVGAPQVRLLAGLRWTPDFTDTDGDGVRDREDRCPTQAEDRDGFEDGDGCPDPDNDGDLVPDAEDKCPAQKEDKDTFQDEDGCPDPDNDGDKVLDVNDHCPFKPETVNGFKDADGCPDVPDQDGDGVVDAQDKCPDKPETVNGTDDADGCPDEGDVTIEQQQIRLARPLRFAGRRIARRSRAVLGRLALALTASPDIRQVGVVARPKNGSRRQKLRWEARAAAVRALLIAGGVDGSRLVVTNGDPRRRPGIELKIFKRARRPAEQ